MAMLAEPRRRRKYNLCPRGKALYEDENRFGTKMLEKMGWSKGRGLGANEDGTQDFVRVRLKNDAEGLGYETRDDQWTTHEEGFNGLLKALNGGQADDENDNNANDNASGSEEEARPMGFGFKAATPVEVKPKTLKEKISGVSLEEKSKHSKARVHYKKFTRGKDLAQYSEKDLANIFGKKATDEIDPPVQVSPPEQTEDEGKSLDPKFSGVQIVSTGLSVQDYFRQKMEAMKNKLKNNTLGSAAETKPLLTGNEEQSETVTANEIEEPAKKKKKKKDKDQGERDDVETELTEESASQQKKKKKSKRAAEDDAAEPVKATLESEETNPPKRKNKNKDKQYESEEFRAGLKTSTKTTAGESKKKNKSNDATAELEKTIPESEEIQSSKRKKKNKDKQDQSEKLIATPELKLYTDTAVELEKSTLESEETNPPKRKKKKKDKEDETEEIITIPELKLSTETTAKCEMKKKKSKKITDPIREIEETVTAEKPSKKKSKKNKTDDKEELIAEPEVSDETGTLTKKKSKKKIDLFNDVELRPEELSATKSKKKSKKHKSDVSADIVCSSDNSDSSANKDDEKYLSMEELIEIRDSYDILNISSFCAEKFHILDMSAFKKSTLAQLAGYGVTDNINIKIEEAKNDAHRIISLWEGRSNKYVHQKEPITVVLKKRKKMIGQLKKRKAFSGI